MKTLVKKSFRPETGALTPSKSLRAVEGLIVAVLPSTLPARLQSGPDKTLVGVFRAALITLSQKIFIFKTFFPFLIMSLVALGTFSQGESGR